MHKPTFSELGADIISLRDKIGDVAAYLTSRGAATLIALIETIRISVPTKTSQLANDSSFTTNTLARADKTLPLYFENRTTDPVFDASQSGRVWYRSDLDV
jgi:hypothetical protein